MKFKAINIKGIKPYYSISENGKVYSSSVGKFLKATRNKKSGYYYVSLMKENNKPKKFYIHDLVAKCFVKGYKQGLVVDHVDTNKINNSYTNLEWVDYGENYHRARNNGLILLGEDLSYTKLTNDQVHEICKMLENDTPYKDIINTIGDIEGNLLAIIKSIKGRERWTHISKDYTWSTKKRNQVFDDELIDKVCKLISEGYGPKAICTSLNIDEYDKIKKLVWFIKKGKTHKEKARKYGII